MGRPPAYIFVVRHGNRLDAADKLWHLSSPTPYDPPLTYGGWSQSRALGQRIGDILRGDASLESATSRGSSPAIRPADSLGLETPYPPKKRRYKVVIHSSPFLRCVQTSIAISSGIASDARPLASPEAFAPRTHVRAPSRTRAQSPLVDSHTNEESGTGTAATPVNMTIDTTIDTTINTSVATTSVTIAAAQFQKAVMRIDAFLGEWLSPGYFELITPPPSSAMMIASAKADLLRREDYSNFIHSYHNQHNTHVHSQSTGHLWGPSRSNTWSSHLEKDEELPKSGSQYVPKPGLFNGSSGSGGADIRRSSSSSNAHSGRWNRSNYTGMHSPALVGYVAPVPHFALSSKAPTPTGYVAHARDACVDLDYQWDSMRAPYDWGDGGEFGEEWTAMHRRFRKGLQRLIDWYATTESPAAMVTRTVHFRSDSLSSNAADSTADSECAIDDDDNDVDTPADDDCDEETVVILVTHGAGCNALIGAITQQPVLIDVGLASLSVAVRRPGKDEFGTPPPPDSDTSQDKASAWAGSVHSTAPGGMVPLHQYYEMKLLASADHLRSIPSTPTTPQMGALGGTRMRHANSVSAMPGAPGNFGLFEMSGTVAHRNLSTGSVHINSGVEMRRPSPSRASPRVSPRVALVGGVGSSVRSSSAAGRTTGGITIGSGVKKFQTFSPPVHAINRVNHPRTPSVGLWSPTIPREEPEDTFSLNDADAEEENDDLEILLSFGPESPQPPAVASQTQKASSPGQTTPTAGPRNSSGDSLGAMTTMKEKFPKLDLGSPRLDASRTASSDRTDKAHSAHRLHRVATAATTATNTIRARTSPVSMTGSGLWIRPTTASNSDELPHENAGSKRRWTVTERSI